MPTKPCDASGWSVECTSKWKMARNNTLNSVKLQRDTIEVIPNDSDFSTVKGSGVSTVITLG